MLKKKEVILSKIESTYNTDPTPSNSTDAILCESFEWANEGLRMLDRPAPKNTIGSYAPVYGGTLKALSIVVRYRGSGAAGTANDMSPLLRACGLSETLNASTSVVYKPVSTGFESCTIYRYNDGKLQKYTGCVGNLQCDFTVGGFFLFTFNMVGHFVSETDVALVSPTYDTTVPPVVLNGAFVANSYSAIISALQFDLGNTLAMPPDFNGSDGFGIIQVTDRKVTGSFDPQDVLVATHNFMSEFTAGTSMVLGTGAVGPAAGNKIQIDMAAIKISELAPGDRDGVATLQESFAAEESSGDDEVTFTFT